MRRTRRKGGSRKKRGGVVNFLTNQANLIKKAAEQAAAKARKMAEDGHNATMRGITKMHGDTVGAINAAGAKAKAGLSKIQTEAAPPAPVNTKATLDAAQKAHYAAENAEDLKRKHNAVTETQQTVAATTAAVQATKIVKDKKKAAMDLVPNHHDKTGIIEEHNDAVGDFKDAKDDLAQAKKDHQAAKAAVQAGGRRRRRHTRSKRRKSKHRRKRQTKKRRRRKTKKRRKRHTKKRRRSRRR